MSILNKRLSVPCLSLLTAVIFTGCTATGGPDAETTLVDVHRRVVKLDQDLEASITALNEDTAELNARVAQNDEQMRKLTQVVEENEVRLNSLTQTLEDLRNTLYRRLNVPTRSSRPSSTSTGGGGGGGGGSASVDLEDTRPSVELVPPQN